MAIPRPLAWTRIYSLHRGALREERVVRVAQRLLTALRDPLAKLNNRLQHLYNAWLLALLARLVWAFGRGWERSAFEQRVLRHVLACMTAQLATHIASACSVLLLIRGDAGADSEQRERVERACLTLVDEALRRLEGRDSTCIVCFSELAVGDRVRSLPAGTPSTPSASTAGGGRRAARWRRVPHLQPQPPRRRRLRGEHGRGAFGGGVGAGAATKTPGDFLGAW